MCNNSVLVRNNWNDYLSKIIFILILTSVILFPITHAETESEDIINTEQSIPPLPVDGREVFEARYRGIERQYIPNPNDPNDSKYNYWDTIAEIKAGFEMLKTISDLNPDRPSLYNSFVFKNNFSKQILLKNILNQRTDNKDFWFADFDTSIDAYTLITEIKMENMTIREVNDLVNNTFELYDYYKAVTNGTINVKGIQVPTWTVTTLKDLFMFRLNNYIGSQNVVLTGTNYKNLGKAVEHGLIKLSDINFQKLNTAMLSNKDSQEYITETTSDKTESYKFFNAYYSKLIQENTNKTIEVNPPPMSSLLDDNSLQDLNGIYAPIQLEISIESLPDQLIQKKYADLGFIYYTNKELVSYNVTIPNDHWDYDENGSLIYITENINQTHTYYKPIPGQWINDYTFVPENPTKKGVWMWK